MRHFEFTRNSSDGIPVFFQGWEPEVIPKAVICLVPGTPDHGGRYSYLASYLTSEGYALFVMDIRGYGRSGGKRGHIISYVALMDDISLLLGEAKARFTKIPIFLYGHSSGGNFVANYVLRIKPKIAGVILTSAWFKLAYNPPTIKVLIGSLLEKIYPGLSMHTGLNINYVSTDPKEDQRYKNDPLQHDLITPCTYFNILRAGEWALQHAGEFSYPLLITHGSEDHITSPAASRAFAEKVPADCTLKIWEGLYHETHNEPKRNQEIFAFLVNWLNQHLG